MPPETVLRQISTGNLIRLTWESTQKLGTFVALLIILLTVLGFRLEKPEARFIKLEWTDSVLSARLGAHEKAQAVSDGHVNMLVRLQCLAMTRQQAVMLNVCEGYKTAEDTMRRRGR